MSSISATPSPASARIAVWRNRARGVLGFPVFILRLAAVIPLAILLIALAIIMDLWSMLEPGDSARGIG